MSQEWDGHSRKPGIHVGTPHLETSGFQLNSFATLGLRTSVCEDIMLEELVTKPQDPNGGKTI